jgi:ParB family chromosome partitioning protein
MTNTREAHKSKHLGKGLESLLGPIISSSESLKSVSLNDERDVNFLSDKELRNSYQEIQIELISPNPYQARTVWNEHELNDLAQSIKANGVIQPVIVRQVGSAYELIAGERRLRAARLAGLEKISALVRKASDEELLEWALIENIHRVDLNPIERARAYQNYISTFELTQTDAAHRLGEDRSVITNYLRILDLPEEIRRMLIDGQLTMGHARAILALPTDEVRRKMANRALAGRLSVREVERLVRRHLTSKDDIRTSTETKPAHILELESNLSRHLGTKVAIETRRNGQRGKIIIEFRSLDEFDSITERIGLTAVEEI